MIRNGPRVPRLAPCAATLALDPRARTCDSVSHWTKVIPRVVADLQPGSRFVARYCWSAMFSSPPAVDSASNYAAHRIQRSTVTIGCNYSAADWSATWTGPKLRPPGPKMRAVNFPPFSARHATSASTPLQDWSTSLIGSRPYTTGTSSMGSATPRRGKSFSRSRIFYYERARRGPSDDGNLQRLPETLS